MKQVVVLPFLTMHSLGPAGRRRPKLRWNLKIISFSDENILFQLIITIAILKIITTLVLLIAVFYSNRVVSSFRRYTKAN